LAVRISPGVPWACGGIAYTPVLETGVFTT